MSENPTASQLVEGAQGVLQVPRPCAGGWTPVAPPAEAEIVITLPSSEGTFAPTLVAVVARYEGPVTDLTAAQVRGYRDALNHPFVIGVRAWGQQHGRDGRRVDYTHLTTEGLTVRGIDLSWVEAGWAITLTGTCTPAQAPVFAQTFEDTAATLTVLASAEESAAYPRDAESDRFLAAAVLDSVASMQTGADREDLTEIGPNRPAMPPGLWLPATTVENLQQRVLGGGPRGRMLEGGPDPDAEALEEAELMIDGVLDPQFEQMLQVWNQPALGVKLNLQLGTASTTFQAWSDGVMALVAAGAGYSMLVDGDDDGIPSTGHVKLGMIPLLSLSTAIARWVGLRPAWSLQGQPRQIPLEALQNRILGSGGAPEDADSALARLWNVTWTTWDLAAVGHGDYVVEGYSCITAGAAGTQRIQGSSAAGPVEVWAVDSIQVFDDTEEIIQSALYQRPARV